MIMLIGVEVPFIIRGKAGSKILLAIKVLAYLNCSANKKH